MGELASRLSLRQTAVTELVKRAEEAGLVERAVSEADRRVFVLRLTSTGEERLLQAFVGLREERRQLVEALAAVDPRFRDVAPSGGEMRAR